MEPTLEFTVSHRGTAYKLSLPRDTSFGALQARLEELTHVSPPNQKLLYKGKKPTTNSEQTVVDAGLKDGVKVQMLGSTAEELGELKRTEDELQRKERIMKERAGKPQTKLRSTGTLTSHSSSLQYRFHHTAPLPHLPNPSTAQTLLTRLAADPAIVHVMQSHQFAVGLLTELAPHEHPNLLGLNENKGQTIKLRLRTNSYDGFRAYSDVRRVLCHELAHNVWGDHDDNFKALNSKLTREVAEFERAKKEGTHRLGGDGDFYEPEAELEVQSFVLGGSSASPRPVLGESPEDRRRRVLEATMRRLQREDEEVEMSCGTAGPAVSADTTESDTTASSTSTH